MLFSQYTVSLAEINRQEASHAGTRMKQKQLLSLYALILNTYLFTCEMLSHTDTYV